MYQVPLIQVINEDHELSQLSERINWDKSERDLSDSRRLQVARITLVFTGILGILLALLVTTWCILSLFDYFAVIFGFLGIVISIIIAYIVSFLTSEKIESFRINLQEPEQNKIILYHYDFT